MNRSPEENLLRMLNILKRAGYECGMDEDTKEEVRIDAYREFGWRMAKKEIFFGWMEEVEKLMDDYPEREPREIVALESKFGRLEKFK